MRVGSEVVGFVGRVVKDGVELIPPVLYDLRFPLSSEAFIVTPPISSIFHHGCDEVTVGEQLVSLLRETLGVHRLEGVEGLLPIVGRDLSFFL